MEQLSAQLERVFSVEHDLEACKDNLKDISVAYGLLLRAAPLPKSSQCCDSLCEEVSVCTVYVFVVCLYYSIVHVHVQTW